MIAVSIWLGASYAVAYRLTQRASPPHEEPLPRLAWGTAESHRLATRDGEELGAWFLRAQVVTGSATERWLYCTIGEEPGAAHSVVRGCVVLP